MLTDAIINEIYSFEKHNKYGRAARIFLRISALAIILFSLIMLIKSPDLFATSLEFIAAIGIIVESTTKKGYEPIVIEDIVNKLITINLSLARISDNKIRVEIQKDFNVLIDKILVKPTSVSQAELNRILGRITEQINLEELEEAYKKKFSSQEKSEKSKYKEESTKQEEEKKKEKSKSTEQKTQCKYFNNCYSMEELNKRKKQLLRQYHPDNHGDELEKKQCENISKEINEEYSILKKEFLNDFSF